MRIFRAALFSVFVNLGSAFVLLRFGALHILSFSGVDELAYLPQSLKLASGHPPTFFHKELDTPYVPGANLLDSHSTPLDIAVGSLGNLLGFAPAELGFALDLICVFLCYLLFSKFFQLFAENKLYAEVAAIIALAIPRLFAIDGLFLLQSPFGEFVLNEKISVTSALPFVRGVYTQLSYLFYPMVLGLGSFAILNRYNLRAFFFSGLLAGLSIHLYFFAWAAGCLLIPVTACIYFLGARNWREGGWRSFLFGMLVFGIASLSGSLLGLYSILFGAGGLTTVDAPEVGWYWYFSPEVFFLLVSCLLCSWFSTSLSPKGRLIASICAGCFFLQLFFMNAQAALGVIISPFRIVSIYLQPIVTGLFTIVVFRFLERFQSNRLTMVTACLLLAVVFVPATRKHVEAYHFKESWLDYELSKYLVENTEVDSVLAIWLTTGVLDFVPETYPLRLLPTTVAATSGRPILAQSWIIPRGLDLAQLTGRELLLGWLYTGTPRFAVPCIEKIPFPGDLLTLTWTGHLHIRKSMCELQEKKKLDKCVLLNSFTVDYVLWDLANRSIPTEVEPFLSKVWQFSEGEAVLYRFDQDAAIRTLCVE